MSLESHNKQISNKPNSIALACLVLAVYNVDVTCYIFYIIQKEYHILYDIIMLVPYRICHMKATINSFTMIPFSYLLYVQFPRYNQNNKSGIGEGIYMTSTLYLVKPWWHSGLKHCLKVGVIRNRHGLHKQNSDIDRIPFCSCTLQVIQFLEPENGGQNLP